MAFEAIHNMIITCLTYLLCKYLLNAPWYMPVLCWFTDIWDPPSDWLHTCLEYIFCAFRSTFASSTLPNTLRADLYGLHQCALLHSGWSGQWEASATDPRTEKEVNPPHCCSPQVLVISLALCSCLPLLTYSIIYCSLPFPPLFSFPQLLWKSMALFSCGTKPNWYALITL